MSTHYQTTVLTILDGWGHRDNPEHNAIAAAKTPHWDEWWQTRPHTLLQASGETVGLPTGQMGNSEVGHMHLGAGRVVAQDYTRINKAIQDGDFFQNDVFIRAIQETVAHHKAIHVFGLLSPGGVHSHEEHILAFLKLAASQGATQVTLHAFLDGRDTPPKSAEKSLERVMQYFSECGHGRIASITGRYYAMDRDQRWDRTQQAYELLTEGKSEFEASDPLSALELAYARNETDEFVQPTRIVSDSPTLIEDGDTVVFMNFRSDRARQLTRALTDKTFSSFTRGKIPKLSHFITLTQYALDIQAQPAFPPQHLTNTVGDIVAQAGKTQLRIAETEKYAHVTFFFDGGHEDPFPGEDRILIPSPKVKTYDLQPEMSAPELTEKLVEAIHSQKYATIICNYANADMVGHTGDFQATVKAVECLDHCLGQVHSALEKSSGEMMITADHGNAECMYNEKTQQAHTAHTTEAVPFIYLGRDAEIASHEASLTDIAPTLLYLMGLEQPAQMTGHSILKLRS